MIPGCPGSDERNTTMAQPHQHHQDQQSSYIGPRRQLGAAPSDGGLVTTALPLQTETTAPEGPAGKRGKANIASNNSSRGDALMSSYSHGIAGRAHNATTKGGSSSNGLPPQQQQQQLLHQQHCDGSLLPSCPASSFSTPNISQRIGTAVATAADGGDDPMSMITDCDIRRAYVTLQHRPENHSSFIEYSEHSRELSTTGQELIDGSPALCSISGESSVKSVQYSQLQHIGRTPSFPTGVPILPTRRGVLGPQSPTSSQKQTGGPAGPNTVPVATVPTAPSALPPAVEENLKPNERAEIRRTSAADGVVVAGGSLAALTRGQTVDGGGQPALSAAVAVDNTIDGALVSTVPSTIATTKGASTLVSSSTVAAQSRPRAAALGGRGAPQDMHVVIPVEPTTIKLTEGLGSWADETVAVGRLVDEDSRRVAAERAGEARREEELRCALERGIGTAVKTLPLRFLKDYGYLRESQKTGLENMTQILKKVAAVARRRAWDR